MTGSALLDELLSERKRIHTAWRAPRRALPISRVLMLRVPKVPEAGEPSLKERVAEALKIRGQIPESQLHTIVNAIYGSDRDMTVGAEGRESLQEISTPIVKIQTMVAEHFNLTREEMLSFSRAQRIIVPRQVAMYLCKLLMKKSLEYIGIRFDREHSTVTHSVKRIEKFMAKDAAFAKEIEMLREMVVGCR